MEDFSNLRYEPDTGLFFWAAPPHKRFRAGAVAGSNRSDGYVVIRYKGKLYQAHRLAWYMTYGKWPSGQIDHIDGNRLNNRISNLRDVSKSLNQQNRRKAQSNNQSGLLGVRWYKQRKKWRAQIKIDGKDTHIGYFKTAEQAHEAYLKAKRTYHEGCTI